MINFQTVVRISGDQQTEEIEICFTLCMSRVTHHSHNATASELFTRNIRWVNETSKTRDIIIKAKNRQRQNRYMMTKDGDLRMGVIDPNVSREECKLLS